MTLRTQDIYAFQLFVIKKISSATKYFTERFKIIFPTWLKTRFFFLSLECDLSTFQAVPLIFLVQILTQHKENDVSFIK